MIRNRWMHALCSVFGVAVSVLVAAGNGPAVVADAAQTGDRDAVRALLKQAADVNAAQADGMTALHWAAQKNDAELAATTKTIDLNGIGRNSPAFAGILFGNPGPPPASGREGGQQARGGRQGGPNGPDVPAVPQAQQQGRFNPRAEGKAGIDRNFQLNELVFSQGGMTPLLFAARQGYVDTATALMDAGADVNQVSAGDRSSPLLVAAINGHFDLARVLLDRGADPHAAAENGATPLYAVINCEWAPKSLYPQPRAYLNQRVNYLDVMAALLDKGADPNARLKKKVWYSGYSFDLSGVDETVASPFWRAAYASDVAAMKLLVAHGADPNIPTMKPAARPRTADVERDVQDVSKTPPIPLGGPGVPPIVAAAGVGYGEGFAANSHRFAPGGMLAAVKYLIEELNADVNATDHEGNTGLHNAAARGDVEMIQYLVAKGANVKAVNREGKTTADMANGPVQRIQPWPEALALLEKLGARNNHKCVSC